MSTLVKSTHLLFAVMIISSCFPAHALTVTDMSPTPGASTTTLPNISITFDQPLNAATINNFTVRLIGAGSDGSFGTADDVMIAPTAITVNSNVLTLDLSGQSLPGGQYQLRLQGDRSIATTSGLTAYWKFDEGTGTTVSDSGGTNSGTLINGPVRSIAQGVSGDAVLFDGVDDYVEVPASPSLEPTGGVTVSAWANITNTRASGVADLVRKANPLNGYCLRWSNSFGQMQWIITRGGQPVNAPTVFVTDSQQNSQYLNGWHNFVGTFDGATGLSSLYVDGVLRASTNGTTGSLDHSGNLWMMWTPVGSHSAIPGFLDEVRVYDRALTQSEVTALANGLTIKASDGSNLDGEKNADFPSGDGTAGGDFIAMFTINSAPVANPQNICKKIQTSLPITLSTTYADADTLSYIIVTPPSHGTLAGIAPDLTYTPDGTFSGTDSFAFKVNDGTSDSNVATVTISEPTTVLAMTPSPGSVLAAAPSSITIDLSNDINPDTIGGSAIQLLYSGADNAFGTADDVVITPDSINVSNKRMTIFSNSLQSSGQYKLTLHGGDGSVANTAGLVGYWKFNEGAGNTTIDSSVSGRSGTLTNGPAWTNSLSGKALHFDGVDDYVDVPSSVDLGGGSFTLFACIYSDSDTSYTYLSKWNDNNNFKQFDMNLRYDRVIGFEVMQTNDSSRFAVGTQIIKPGRWYSVAAVADTSTAEFRLYINGKPETLGNTPSWDGTVKSRTMELNIGRKATGNIPWQGFIDNVRIYNRALNDAEISALTTVADFNGNSIDGEFSGSFPTGDGNSGGDFIATFRADAPPVAAEQNICKKITGTLSITLSATDPDGDALTYSVVTPPAHGALSGTAPDFTYTPDGTFTGSDSFTFKAKDGVLDSNIATVTIVPPTKITAISPAPASMQTSAPSNIQVTFSSSIDPETVNSSTCRLIRAGTDHSFGTNDDVIVPLTDNMISVSGSQLTIDLTGQQLPPDKYQIQLLGGISVAPSSGLVAYWPLNEASGTSVSDASGNGNNGTLTGGTWTTGVSGSALDFGATGDVVSIGRPDIAPPWTASMWVRRKNSTNPSSQLMATRFTYSLKLEQYNDTKKVGVTIIAAEDPAFNYTAPIGQWTHLTFVGTNSNTSLYVNGSFQDTVSTVIKLPMSQISDAGHSASATMDEIRVYNRALNSSEIANIAGVGIEDMLGNIIDGDNDSNPGGDFLSTFTITTAPKANDQIVCRQITGPISITLTATDPEGDTLNYSIVTPPSHGSLSGVAPNLTYTPDGTFTGSDSFTFKANDGVLDSNTASVTITAPTTVTSMSPAPESVLALPPEKIAISFSNNIDASSVGLGSIEVLAAGPDRVFGTQDDATVLPDSVTVSQNVINITASSIQGPGNYRVRLKSTPRNQPTSGLMAYWKLNEGTGSNTADSSGNGNTGVLNSGATWGTGYFGNAVQFDGATGAITVPRSTSLEPTNGITVSMWGYITSSVNGRGDLLRKEAPYVGGYVLRWDDGTHHVQFHIDGNTPGQYWVCEDPSPNSNYVNSWHLYTGTYDCTTQTLKLYIDGVLKNSVSGGLATLEHTDDLYLMFVNYVTEVGVSGKVDDVRIYDHALSAAEIQSLAAVQPYIVDVNGNAIDGEFSGAFPSGDGTPGGDFIARFRVNAAPIADAQIFSTHFGNSLPITLSGSDADADPITFQLISQPAHGLLSGTPPQLLYTPDPKYVGNDSFAFTTNDGFVESAPASVNISVLDHPPVAQPLSLTVHAGHAIRFSLPATDADADPLTYSIPTPPAHGQLSGTAPDLTYKTDVTFTGTVSFNFIVDDGAIDHLSFVTINITNASPGVTASTFAQNVALGSEISFIANGSDPDVDPLVYSWSFDDGASSSEQNPTHSFSQLGTHTALVTVTDPIGATATAIVSVNVVEAPIPKFVTSDIVAFGGRPFGFDASGSIDPGNGLFSYSWDFGDGSPPAFGAIVPKIYDQPGTYLVTLTVTDSVGVASTLQRVIEVLPHDQLGIFHGFFHYKTKWNRDADNKDSLTLEAQVNVGDLVVAKDSSVAIDIVGQHFEGVLDGKLRDYSDSNEKWQLKANVRNQPLGTVLLKVKIKNASLGLGFNQAGAVAGADLHDLVQAEIPVRVTIGGNAYELNVSSDFKFSSAGHKASGEGEE